MIEQINSDILIMFAVITATLLGFAFLTPVIQAMSSGLFSRAAKFIEVKILYKRVLGMTSLPIFLFFWPFLISILLITIGDINNDKIQIAIMIGNIAFGVFCLILFIWIKSYSGFKAGFIITLQYVPLLVCIIGVIIVVLYKPITLYLNFVNFIYLTNLLFISLGLSLILRNFMASFDRGLWFKSSEIYQECVSDVEKEFESIELALNYREELVNRCKCEGQKEWYAKGSSEITFLREQYKGREEIFEGLYDKWEKITKKLPRFSLNDVFEFDNSRKRIVEEYLPKFECTTEEIKKRLEGG